jgi:hypothetical protein
MRPVEMPGREGVERAELKMGGGVFSPRFLKIGSYMMYYTRNGSDTIYDVAAHKKMISPNQDHYGVPLLK